MGFVRSAVSVPILVHARATVNMFAGASTMSTSSQPFRLGTRQVLVYAALLISMCLLLTLPSALIAGAVWFAIGRKFKRVENAVLCFGGLLLLLTVGIGSSLKDQVLWMVNIIGFGDRDWTPPFIGSIALGVFYAGLYGLVVSTMLWGKISTRSSSIFSVFRSPFAQDSLVPTEGEKSKVRLVQPPGGIITNPAHISKSGAEPGKRSLAIGLNRRKEPVYISEQEISMHGMILGSTGSGKTETIKVLAASLADMGWTGMVLDLKEDTARGGLREFLDTYAMSRTTPFQQLAISDPTPEFWFNPLEGMGPDEARDTILSLTDYDDEYWKNINKKLLGQIVTLVFDAHHADPQQFPYPTILEIGRILSAGDISSATRKMRGVIASATGRVDDERYSALIMPTPDEAKSASGFGAKLTQMYNTQVGRTVLRPDQANPRPSLDVTAKGITYIGLDTQSKKDLSLIISSAVLQRMSVYSGQRTRGEIDKSKTPRFIIIDEANVINRDIVKMILQKARGARLAIVLCTQGPDDWIDTRGDDWSAMSNNINFAIIGQQGSFASAEKCAEFIGERNKLQVSQQVDMMEYGQRSTLRETVDYLVAPHELRALSIGEAILRINKPTEKVTWLTVKRRDPTARLRAGS
jgi:hypothetical protein